MKRTTIAEQIASFEARRASSTARMDELMQLAGEEGATLDTAQQEEFDTLELDIKSIDGHLRRLHLVEQQQVAAAIRPEGIDVQRASVSRSSMPVISIVKSNVAKGTAFTRYAIALMRARGDLVQAAEIAKGWHDSTPEVELVLRAAVSAGTTTDPAWAGPLVEYQAMAQEFIEYLRPATIIGRIAGFREVPFNIKIPAQLTPSSAQWVGEGRWKPVSRLTFQTVQLGHAKAAGIVVMTEELVRFSNPAAEGLVRTDLADTVTQFLDLQFLDPSVAAVANVSPASITNGAPKIDASGDDAAAIKRDVRALFALFVTANLSVAGAYWVMDPVMALTISMMQTPLAQAEFPGINMNGGTFFGLPVICSNNIAKTATGGARIVLLQPKEILLADEGGIALDASREASLLMDDAPTGAGQLVSLWQTNMVALRAERMINWLRRRVNAVAYIDNAEYTNSTAMAIDCIHPQPPDPEGNGGVTRPAPKGGK